MGVKAHVKAELAPNSRLGCIAVPRTLNRLIDHAEAEGLVNELAL